MGDDQAHGNQALAVSIRQRPKQASIYDAEHCGRGADRKLDRPECRECETAVPSESPYRKCGILAKVIEPLPAPQISAFIVKAQRIAKRAATLWRHHLAMRRHFVIEFAL